MIIKTNLTSESGGKKTRFCPSGWGRPWCWELALPSWCGVGSSFLVLGLALAFRSVGFAPCFSFHFPLFLLSLLFTCLMVFSLTFHFFIFVMFHSSSFLVFLCRSGSWPLFLGWRWPFLPGRGGEGQAPPKREGRANTQGKKGQPTHQERKGHELTQM